MEWINLPNIKLLLYYKLMTYGIILAQNQEGSAKWFSELLCTWFDRKNLKEGFSSASDQVRSRKGQWNKRKLTEKPFTLP